MEPVIISISHHSTACQDDLLRGTVRLWLKELIQSVNHPFQSPLNEIGFWVDKRLGNTRRYYLSPSEDANMRVPDEVLKSVVFLGFVKLGVENQETPYYGATGFFVSLDCVNIVGKVSNYLVTARHVVDEIGDKPFVLRVNTIDGKLTIVKRELKWFYHPTDEAIDVAVAPIKYIPSIDCAFIATSMSATDDIIQKENIGVGDEVFATVLFSGHSGSQRNMPILRIADIAMMSHERILIRYRETEDRKAEVYLIDDRKYLLRSACVLTSFGNTNLDATTPLSVTFIISQQRWFDKIPRKLLL